MNRGSLRGDADVRTKERERERRNRSRERKREGECDVEAKVDRPLKELAVMLPYFLFSYFSLFLFILYGQFAGLSKL